MDTLCQCEDNAHPSEGCTRAATVRPSWIVNGRRVESRAFIVCPPCAATWTGADVKTPCEVR